LEAKSDQGKDSEDKIKHFEEENADLVQKLKKQIEVCLMNSFFSLFFSYFGI